ncbi:MAG: hypothetical protein ACFFDK_04640 [Promethearchaeota archaeon]
MPLNSKFKRNYIFEGKIREFEKELVKISLEIEKRRGQNPVISKILIYLLMYEHLTQKQLKNLTGYSIGSISTHLSAMNSIGIIEKKLIRGTHTNIYSLKIDLGQNISSLVKMSRDYINQTFQFLKSKKTKLNEIFNKKKEKIKPILERFEEIETVIGVYAKLFEMINNSNNTDFEIEIRESRELDYIQDFNDEIKIIEDDIIDFFTYTPMFFGKTELFSKTFAYFITRKTLTQKKIRKLTGLSAGKVSQEINNLLNYGIIEITEKSETGQLTYQMKSVISAFLKISSNILSEYMKWKDKIEKIKFELEEQREVLKTLNGYKEVLKFSKYFTDVLPIYEKIYYAILKIRAKLNIS